MHIQTGHCQFSQWLAFFLSDHCMRLHLCLEQGGKRSDGRTPLEIRPINAQCGLLPRSHGSALFTRGETQVS